MVTFKKKFLFFKIKEIWFGYSFHFVDLIGLTAFLHIKNLKGKIYGVRLPAYTVENNLLESPETIFSKFHSTIKNNIRQAEKENITCSYEDNFDAFISFYNEFAKNRKLPSLTIERLNEMKHCLEISFAVYQDQKVAAHSYLVDKEIGIISLMHSATIRFDNEFDKNLAGRINKLLHYKDMLYYKEKGFKIYDFGGYAHQTKDKGLSGINDFKISFGGEKVASTSYVSYAYYFLKKMAALTGMIGRA